MSEKESVPAPEKESTRYFPIGATIPRHLIRLTIDKDPSGYSAYIYKATRKYAEMLKELHGEAIPDIRVNARKNITRRPDELKEIAKILGAFAVEDINWSRLFADALLIDLIMTQQGKD